MTRLPAALLLLPLLLVGCTAASDPEPAPGTAAPPVEETASPSPTASPSSAAPDPAAVRITADDIPTDCRELVDASTYAKTFGDVPLNDPALTDPEALPYGDVEPFNLSDRPTDIYTWVDAGQELLCSWGDPAADVTRLGVLVSVIDPAESNAEFDLLEEEEGYECDAFEYGRKCQLVGQHSEYPVTEARTWYVRGDIVIAIYQANFPTDNLLGSIINTLWSE